MRILFVTWNGSGNLQPQIAAARLLRSEGHSLYFLSHAATHAAVAPVGAFRAFERVPDMYEQFVPDDDAWWDGLFMSGAVAEETLAAISCTDPDVVVIDCLLWGGLAAAEKAHLPAVVFVHTLYSRFFSNLSGENVEGRTGAMNAMRARIGLPPAATVMGVWDSAIHVLVASTRRLDLPVDVRPNVRHVGPLRPPNDRATQGEGWRAGQVDLPLVLVSFTTARIDQSEALQRVLDALADCPVRVLVTTGPFLDQRVLRGSTNSLVVPYAPHDDVLPAASLCVTHAGHGTVMAALSHAVPVLCLPPPFGDMPAVASCVVRAGAGLEIPYRASPSAITDAVGTILSDSQYLDGSRQAASVLASELDLDGAIVALTSLG